MQAGRHQCRPAVSKEILFVTGGARNVATGCSLTAFFTYTPTCTLGNTHTHTQTLNSLIRDTENNHPAATKRGVTRSRMKSQTVGRCNKEEERGRTRHSKQETSKDQTRAMSLSKQRRPSEVYRELVARFRASGKPLETSRPYRRVQGSAKRSQCLNALRIVI